MNICGSAGSRCISRSLDGANSGYWSTTKEDWIALDPQYNRDVAEALRVARNQVAPQLLQLPMLAPGEAS